MRFPSLRPTGDSRRTFGRAITVLVTLMMLSAPLIAVASPEDSPELAGGDRAAEDPAEWLTFKGDNQRTGVAASEAPSVDKVLWELNYKGSIIYSSPTVWNGTVYVGVSGSIKAIWAKNGTERWTYVAPNPIHTAPVIENGVIYAGVNDFSGTGAVAVDALTGEEIWNASIPDFVTASPLVMGNNVYVGCQNSVLYCLRKSDGSEEWNFTADRAILYGSIATAGGLLYFGIEADNDQNGKVYAINASTGDEAWNATIVGSVWSSPTVAPDRLLVSTAADKSLGTERRNGYVYSFNLTTGAQLDRSRNLGMVMASPSVANGRVYVGTFGKVINDIQLIAPMMYCLDLADLDIIWNKTVTHQTDNAKVWSSVTIAGSKIIFGDELGFLNVWNINGIKIWDHAINLGAAVKTTPAVAQEMVFAANTLGDMVGFGSQPDLSVNSTVIDLEDDAPHLGQRVNVRAKISNLGDKTATGRVFLYNGSLEDWHTVINSTTVILEPSKSIYVYAIWTADEVGNRAVWVRIMDVRPNEADEANNEALRVVEVRPPAEGWLTARSDPTGDGYEPTEPPSNNLTKWLRAEGSNPGKGLVSTMESVFFPVGSKLVALDRLEGTVDWSRDLGDQPTTPPAVGDGAVFIGTESGKLIGLDLEDGTLRFSRQLDGEVSSGPTVVGWTVIVGTTASATEGSLYALNTFDGSDVWSRDMGAAVNAHPAVSNGRVFAVSDDGAALSLNLSDGALQWQYPVGNPPGRSLTAAPIVNFDRLYVASSSGFVYCLDADPGDGVDEGKVDPDGSGYDVIWTYRQEELAPFNSSPVLVDELLVMIIDDDRVLALDAQNGSIAWVISMSRAGTLTTELIAVNGSIVVAGTSVHIISTQAGVETWTYDGSTSAMVGNPAAVDDMLFVTDDRGILFAFGKVQNLPPVARIDSPVPDEQFRINESIIFDATSTTDDKELPDTSFHWDFGDGNISLARVTSHRFVEAGLYRITLTVTDTDGKSDNSSLSIRVMGNHDPVLDWWDVSPDQGIALVDQFNFSVRYTDPDNDPPDLIVLRLADEREFQPLNMVEVDENDDDYTDGKLYHFIITLGSRPYNNVIFKASDGITTTQLVVSGPTVLQTRTFANSVGDIEVTATYVGPNLLEFRPVTSAPSTFPAGLHPIEVFVELYLNTTFLKSANISINYTFHAVDNVDLTTLAVYRWSFSDQDAGWQYLGLSQVDLGQGVVTAPIPSLQKDIYTVLGNRINPPANNAPVPIISVDGQTYSPGVHVKKSYSPDEVVEFDAEASYDPDIETLGDRIEYWSWNFDDGDIQQGKLASHSFRESRSYTVTLTVRDSFGKEDSVTVIVTVRAEEENTLLYLLVFVGIIIILLLLFYPKGGSVQKPVAKEEMKESSNGPGVEKASEEKEDNGAIPKTTEIDDIIDELEVDRGS
jgi:outer membrane protein assembly factor BamB